MSDDPKPPADPRADVAIVGMACLFPGAPDLATYWRNIVNGVDAIVDPPSDSWDVRTHFDPDADSNDRIYCKRGGYLGELATFDPLEHGVLPLAVEGGEPEQWLALRVAKQAVADAGFPDGVPDGERTAVLIGKGDYVNRGNLSALQHHGFVDQALDVIRALNPELTEEDLQLVRRDIKASLPPFSADTVPALIPNIAAGRIANRLDLMGPSYTVDAACASSLIAVDMAMRELRSGTCDRALVGGLHVVLPMLIRQVFCQLGALSRTETIRPFDRSADGTILGEGVGFVVLQRREDAEREGRRIYAVVKGTGTSSDGQGLSVMAPRLEGEVLALRRAYERTGIDPATVALIEAHGTGTPVGDATEVEALMAVFGPRRAALPHRALGSVKSMLGHLMPASGMAALIKTALALHHGTLPPTLNVETPNRGLRAAESPFYVSARARPWIHGSDGAPRRAGIDSFGFGGINVHAILEEHADPGREVAGVAPAPEPDELFVVAGADRADLVRRIEALDAWIAGSPGLRPADLAAALAHRATDAGRPSRLGVVATTTDDLRAKLRRAAEKLGQDGTTRIRDARRGIFWSAERYAESGKLAFLFPGEGSQYPWMLSDLCLRFPEMRDCFDITERGFARAGIDERPSDGFFPPALWSSRQKADAEAWLWEMRGAVTAVLTADYAMLRLFRRLGIEPDAMLGHSTGEFPAIVASGMIDLDADDAADRFVLELHDLFHRLDRSDAEFPPASLLAVGGDREAVDRVIRASGGLLRVAMDNCPHQTVITGPPEAVRLASDALRRRGLICETLAFDRPYHTPHFEGFAPLLRDFLVRWIGAPPRVPTWTCATRSPFPDDVEAAREIAVQQWMRPVAFRETIEAMHDDGVRLFVEVGARGNLCAFVDDILRGRPHLSVAPDLEKKPGMTQLHRALAQLVAHGVPVDLPALYRDRDARPLDLDAPAAAHNVPSKTARVLPTGWPELRLTEETLARLRARRGSTASAAPMRPAAAAGETAAGAAPAREQSSIRQRVLESHLRSMDRFLEQQKRVMGDYLARRRAGGPGIAARVAAEPPAPVSRPASTPATAGPVPSARESLSHGRATPAFSGRQTDAVADDGEARVSTLPMLTRIVTESPGESLVAIKELDPADDRFLLDHTFGRRVSVTDPELAGMPVCPLTFSMEMMAQAASLLAPGDELLGFRDVRGFRWITADRGTTTLRLHASCLGGSTGRKIRVQVFEGPVAAAGESHVETPLVESTVLFGRYDPAPETPARFFLRNERPAKWGPGELYEHVMFHEGAMQGVRSVDAMGDDGARATIAVAPRETLFAATRAPRFLCDPVLLDQVGQVVGYWAREVISADVFFPFYVGEVRLYGPPLPEGSVVTCRAKIETTEDGQVLGDLTVLGEDGRVLVQVDGWRDRRFRMPVPVTAFFLEPRERMLSRVDASPERVQVRLGPGDFPPKFFIEAGGIWRRSLALAVLGRSERDAWVARTERIPERVAWLLERLAAKDAIRRWLARQHGLEICPADILLRLRPGGKIEIGGPWVAGVPGLPVVRVTRDGDDFVATCADSGRA